MSKLLSSLPVGSRFCDKSTTYNGKPIVWIIGEHNHIGYPDNTITLISQYILKLCAFDGKEPTNPVSGRNLHGNNRYSLSNIRRWLNEKGTNWYSQSTTYDTPPTSTYTDYNAYAGEAGFLTGFSTELLSKIVPTTVRTSIPSLDGGGYEETTDRVFLLSEIEAGYTNANTAEGYKIAYSRAWGRGTAYPTQEAVDLCQIKTSGLSATEPWYWLFRTPYTGDGYRVIGTNEGLYHSPYCASDFFNGIRPVINVYDDIEISDTPDENGVYCISSGTTPSPAPSPDEGDTDADDEQTDGEGTPESASSDIYDIGDVSTSPSYTFGLETESYSDISVRLKGPAFADAVDNGNGTCTVTLDEALFGNLKNGRYYIYVDVTDTEGNKTTTKAVFNKVAESGEGDDDNPEMIDLGSISEPPCIEFSVADDDLGQSLTITQRIDGVTVDKFTSVSRFARYSVTITQDKWDLLSIGSHKMTLTVKDSREAVAERVFTFVKIAGQHGTSNSGNGCHCIMMY